MSELQAALSDAETQDVILWATVRWKTHIVDKVPYRLGAELKAESPITTEQAELINSHPLEIRYEVGESTTVIFPDATTFELPVSEGDDSVKFVYADGKGFPIE
ncbi:hypothetical protein [Glycomyces sp. MUSA5-2]|uniref:hypothetical protein n=1 Tax=Glycomyces sp. MUSA5-2 TaxID=2053002 RepID=UPI00300A9792